MDKHVGFIKTTVIGGLIFLIPFVIIVSVLGKAINTMIVVARPLEKMIPLESIGGIAVIHILAILLVVFVCFLAGMLAKSSAGKRSFTWLDSKLIMLIPGYSFIKGFAGTMEKDESKKVMIPVLAKLDDQTLLGFEVERLSDGQVVVFLPGSPDTTSGTVAYMTEDRVERLDIDFAATYKILRTLGRGSEQFIKK
jgi:uncharacterized membrane protein